MLRDKTDNVKLKQKISSLIQKKKEQLKIIPKLTKLSELILNELGLKNGWRLIVTMSYYASSPKSFHFSEKPKDKEEFKKLKIKAIEEGKKDAEEDPNLDDPTGRFIEMMIISARCIHEIKRSLKRGSDINILAANIAYICGHKVESIPDKISVAIEQLKLIIENENLINNIEERYDHAKGIEFLNYFKEIAKEESPSFWFLTDINSGKIIFATSKTLLNKEELWGYFLIEILKYQYLKSLKKGENLINCLDNKLPICQSDCKKCLLYKDLINTRKFYEITCEFSYKDMVRELNED